MAIRISNGSVRWFFEMNGLCVAQLKSAEFPTTSSLVIQFGNGMDPKFLRSIPGGFFGTTSSVVTVDPSGKVLYRDNFTQANTTSLVMPPVDATTRAAVYVTATLFVRGLAMAPVSKSPYVRRVTAKAGPTSSNFKLTIDGVDCTHVSKVDGYTVTSGGSVGILREGVTDSGQSLVAHLVESKAAGFRSWQQAGNGYKSAVFQYLSSDLRQANITLSFARLRIDTIVPAVPTNPNEIVTVNLKGSAPSVTFKS